MWPFLWRWDYSNLCIYIYLLYIHILYIIYIYYYIYILNITSFWTRGRGERGLVPVPISICFLNNDPESPAILGRSRTKYQCCLESRNQLLPVDISVAPTAVHTSSMGSDGFRELWQHDHVGRIISTLPVQLTCSMRRESMGAIYAFSDYAWTPFYFIIVHPCKCRERLCKPLQVFSYDNVASLPNNHTVVQYLVAVTEFWLDSK